MGASDATIRATDVLVDAVQRLAMARTMADVQTVVRTAARRLTGADGATFVLRDGDKCHYADEDAISPLWKGLRFPLTSCISGWAMLNRTHTAIPDIYLDDRIPHDAYRPTFVKSLAMMPIRRLDPVGAIGAYWATHHEATDEELQLLQALADTTAVALENVRLLEELERRVDERTADLERVLRTLAHEVRNPLAASDGLLELMLADGLPPVMRDDLEHVRAGVNEGLRIVGEQLERARLQAGAMRVHPTPIDVEALFDALHGTLRGMRRNGRVELIFDTASAGPVRTDRNLLVQILRNLLSNALKFTDAGSVRVHVEGDDDSVVFVVADTGVGMTPEELRAAIEEFVQLPAHQGARPAGSGLGLPLVRRLTEALGGRLELASTPGAGTTARVILPRG